jgi:hypothetical protein
MEKAMRRILWDHPLMKQWSRFTVVFGDTTGAKLQYDLTMYTLYLYIYIRAAVATQLPTVTSPLRDEHRR